MATVSHQTILALRDLFVNRFSNDELNDLAFALGIDYEDIPGNNRNAKARELAQYLNRRGLMDKLREVGPQVREDIDWAEVFSHDSPTKPIETTSETPKLNYTELQQLVPILADYAMFQTPDGRRSVLTLAGVEKIVNVDLNGSARLVASGLLVQLNDYGRTPEGDFAVTRLLNFLSLDDALPPAHKTIITTTTDKFQ